MKIVTKYPNGPTLIEPNIYKDDRGYFFESFNDQEFKEKVADVTFVQDNESKSSYGVLRGMHFQTGDFTQAKLVRVIKGEVVDADLKVKIIQWYIVNFYLKKIIGSFLYQGALLTDF